MSSCAKLISLRAARRLAPKHSARAAQSSAVPGSPTAGSTRSLAAKSCAEGGGGTFNKSA